MTPVCACLAIAGLIALAPSAWSSPPAGYTFQTLEQATALFHSATNTSDYAAVAMHYGHLVEEEGIRNGWLFYTIGNCWYMAGETGKAILNYRRAERFMPGNPDLRHNLDAALSLRADYIPEAERRGVAATLLGWHYGTPTTWRWRVFAPCWVLFWGLLVLSGRSRRKELRIGMFATGALSTALLVSLAAESHARRRADPGVVVAREVVARKGDGPMYAPSFGDPLHAGTEFQTLGVRGEWWHIRLADGSVCWIPASAAETVAKD